MPELMLGSWELDHTVTRAQHDRMVANKGRPLTDIIREYKPRPLSIDLQTFLSMQLRIIP